MKHDPLPHLEPHHRRLQYLSSRYERTGNLQDLETAINRSVVASEATPEDHPERPKVLNNLGFHFSRRYGRTGNLQDLEAAIAYSEEAVRTILISVDHPDRAVCLNNLGMHLNSRYKHTGNMQDLEAAIHRTEAALDATPTGHPGHSTRWNNLGLFFFIKSLLVFILRYMTRVCIPEWLLGKIIQPLGHTSPAQFI